MFLDDAKIRTDCCAKEAKDVQNTAMANYELYQYLPVPCASATAMRSPDFQYDHPNLRAGIGYGLSDSCTIDTYSGLRNDPAQLTRDRCKVQLFARMFQSVPCLKPGVFDSDKEMPLIEGQDTSMLEGVLFQCKKTLSEVDYDRFTPLVPCLKDTVQNERNIVPPWKWGGENTRDAVRQAEFLQSCGYKFDGRVWR